MTAAQSKVVYHAVLGHAGSVGDRTGLLQEKGGTSASRGGDATVSRGCSKGPGNANTDRLVAGQHGAIKTYKEHMQQTPGGVTMCGGYRLEEVADVD